MKLHLAFFLCALLLLSSCATIIGGSYYYANVQVKGKPNTNIYYKNAFKGKGLAVIKIKRSEANNFAITLKEDSCQEQTFNYTSRTFRGLAFGASAFTGIGIVTDLLSGAVWKPDVSENYISQVDFKTFDYDIYYLGCPATEVDNKMANKIIDIIFLKNGSIVSGLILETTEFDYKFKPLKGEITFIKKVEVEKTMKSKLPN